MEVTSAAGGVSTTSPMDFVEALSDDGSLAAASPEYAGRFAAS
jgi:hypothetical protein